MINLIIVSFITGLSLGIGFAIPISILVRWIYKNY